MSVKVASCSQLTITGHSFGSFPTISIPGLILCLLNKAVWVFFIEYVLIQLIAVVYILNLCY